MQPPNDVATEDLACAIGTAIRAPSSHNSQPWKFQVVPTGIDLRADWTRLLRVVDAEGRELTMSCGAALFHLRCALQHLGYGVSVQLLPDLQDMSLLAQVRCARPSRSSDDEPALYATIERRQTHRGPFENRPVAQSLLDTLRGDAEAEGVGMAQVDAESDRRALADLVAQGDRLQYANREFREELSAWLRPDGSKRGDGLSGHSVGFPGLASRIAPALLRAFDVGRLLARTDRGLTLAAPGLVVIYTSAEDVHSWLAAGQALGRVLLRAATNGLRAGFMNQPVQCPELRGRLSERFCPSSFAQLVVRLGYAPCGKPSPRRSIDEVITSSNPPGSRLH